jgi:hypothetical protein
MQWK